MGKIDTATRMYLKDKERFADFFNGTVFQGRQVIQAEDLSAYDTRAESILPHNDGKTKEVEHYRDIAMSWNDGVRLAILACENQSKVHYAMPLRTMMYDGVLYTEQAGELWKEKGTENVTSAEFLSHFRKEDKLTPVITMVFYYGEEKWDGSRTLHEMLDMRGMDEKLKEYIPDYPVNLVTPDGGVNKELFRTDLQQIFGVLECRGDRRRLEEYLEEEKEYFRQVDYISARAIGSFLGSEAILNKVLEKQKEEKIDMCKAIDDIYNEGVGHGVAEGRAKGRAEFLAELVHKKMGKGMTAEDIADMLEVPVEEVCRFV